MARQAVDDIDTESMPISRPPDNLIIVDRKTSDLDMLAAGIANNAVPLKLQVNLPSRTVDVTRFMAGAAPLIRNQYLIYTPISTSSHHGVKDGAKKASDNEIRNLLSKYKQDPLPPLPVKHPMAKEGVETVLSTRIRKCIRYVDNGEGDDESVEEAARYIVKEMDKTEIKDYLLMLIQEVVERKKKMNKVS